jgi:hypothetical protein
VYYTPRPNLRVVPLGLRFAVANFMGKWAVQEVYLLRSSDDVPERWTGVGGLRSPTFELGADNSPK